FVGFDYHPESIKTATQRAEDAGVSDRVTFEVADSTQFPGNYDFVAVFDALHDMANPHGAASQIFKSLKADGSWMIVEPFSSDKPKENHNPIGRMFYGASATVCTPCSIAGNGPGLGAQAGPTRIGDVVKSGGFTKFRVATQTPMNIIYEANP
ncbi:MAG: methyltransferase domain-containing protein, partial [Nitrosopumilaceae archaeon]